LSLPFTLIRFMDPEILGYTFVPSPRPRWVLNSNTNLRSLYTVVPKEFDKTGLTEKSPEDIIQLMRFWLKLNENKHPERPFRHEIYLKEMIRYGRLPDL
jgi:hypothetical protein